MRVCFTINCMRNHDDFVSYDKLIKDGLYQAVELFYPYNVNLNQALLYTKEVTQLVNNNKELETVLHLPHGGKNDFVNEDGSINEETFNLMINAIDYASLFHVKKLTLHLGHAWKDMNRKNLLDKVLNQVEKLCEYSSKYGMFVMIENMPRDTELGYGIEEMKYIMEYLSSKVNNIKFIFDTGHGNCSKDNINSYIDALHEYLFHLHISDNNGLADEHKAMGLGNIDFKSFFITLNKYKYKELHCLEILFKDSNDLINNYKNVNEFNKYYL